MLAREFRGFFNIFRFEDLARKVGFDDVLQPGYFGVVEETAAGADVGINEASVGRVLPPMAQLVAIGVEDRVEA